jgi:hypothetical protein
VLGGITGLLGGIVNRIADYKMTKERHKHEQVMAENDFAYLKLETERDIQVAREQANIAREQAGLDAMAKSYEADQRKYLEAGMLKDAHPYISGAIAVAMAFVDFVRGMTRPGLTLYLCILTTLIYFNMQGLLKELDVEFDADKAANIVAMLVDAVIYLTTMAVGWWFATRAKRQD